MPLALIFLLLSVVVLGYASWYDYKNKMVQTETIVLLIIFGLLYNFTNNSNWVDVLGFVILMAVLFGLPCLIGMGLGDLFLFIGLGLFFNDVLLFRWFLVAFLMFSCVWTAWYVYRFSLLKDKKELNRFEFPLVPVILFSFLVYVILLGLHGF